MAQSKAPDRTKSVVPVLIDLDTQKQPSLQRQCYAAIRDAILSGRLAPGARLPSTRALAVEHGVSRNTVAAAFDQLRAEGYLDARERAGTFVTRTIPDKLARVASRHRPAAPVRGSATGLPPRAALANCLWPPAPIIGDVPRAFRSGVPALEAFPMRLWQRLVAQAWRQPLRARLDYGDPRGLDRLRVAIAEHVAAARGARCEAEQVLVVGGSQQGLDLAVRCLFARDDIALVEDPGYLGARTPLAAAGVRIVPVPVDAEGFDIARADSPGARAAFVSPSHQYPLGVTMSVSRRLALLAWAARTSAWIVEDDYDSEFRYASRPLPCLQGLDTASRVIYVGTFSKTIFPALRLGYLIVPPSLVDRFAAARAATDRHSPTVDQSVLATFIADGHYARHVRRMRALYAERQEALLAAGRGVLASSFEIRASGAGMHLVAWLRHTRDDAAVSRAALALGVETQPISRFALRPHPRGGLLLGYAAYTPAEIDRAAVTLARVAGHTSCGPRRHARRRVTASEGSARSANTQGGPSRKTQI